MISSKTQPRWAASEIRWSVDWLSGRLPSRARLVACCRHAWQSWTRICGICAVATDAVADVQVGMRDLGGSLIALSDMPSPDNRRQLVVVLNSRLAWEPRGDPHRGWLDPVRVLAHELGHVLGIGHGPRGALMYPEYGVVSTPQTWDVAEARARYGPPQGEA